MFEKTRTVLAFLRYKRKESKGACANNAATLAFPKEGKGDREAVDEDVGTCYTGKHFGIRLFKGVRYSFVDRGSRREQAPALRVGG